MLIDWFTVGAQALNFLILVWLMKRFLYKPVQDAIAARDKHIAGELAEADRQKVEARHERDDFQRKNETFDQERAALLKTATDDANGERQRLLDAAGKAADALAAKRSQTLQADAENLSRGLRQRAQDEVFAIARKTLADLASVSLEERICETFLRRLRDVGGVEKERLVAAFDAKSGPLLVRSTFELPAAQRAAIAQAVHETFATDAELTFQTAPELVGGIEISAGGHKLAWSIAASLTSLERGVAELVKLPSVPQAVVMSAAKAPALAAAEAAPAVTAPAVPEPAPS